MSDPEAGPEDTRPEDTLTVMRCQVGRRATKQWVVGQEKPNARDSGWQFFPHEWTLRGIADIEAKLRRLDGMPNAFVIRGQPIPGIEGWRRRLKIPKMGKPKRDSDGNLIERSTVVVAPATFVEHPRRHAAFDLDGVRMENAHDLATVGGVRAMGSELRAMLPPEFAKATTVVQLTSSAGHAKDPHVMSARLWFWLDTPAGQEELTAMCSAANVQGLDPACFRTVQEIFTARPLYEPPRVDPIAERVVLLDGSVDVVAWPGYEPPKRPEQPARAAKPPPSNEPIEVKEGRSAYARKTLENVATDLGGAVNPDRHPGLIRAAARVGGLVPGYLAESEVTRALAQACERNGMIGEGREAEVLRTITDGIVRAEPWHPPEPPPKPKKRPKARRGGDNDAHARERVDVVIEGNEAEETETARRLLGGDARIYLHAGRVALVLPRADPRTPARISGLGRDALGERTTRHVRFWKADAKGTKRPVPCPASIKGAIHSNPEGEGGAKFRRLERITRAPTMRADGTVLDVLGYDAATRLYYAPSIPYEPVSDVPTRAETEAAVALVMGKLKDFPFAEASDRGTAVAAMLTLFAYPAYAGPVAPLVSITASRPGSGKTSLLDGLSALAGGFTASLSGAASDEEMGKAITAAVAEDASIIGIDNVRGDFGGPSVEEALTRTDRKWTRRRLGVSRFAAGTLRALWVLTANNATYRGDMGRRILVCRLAPPYMLGERAGPEPLPFGLDMRRNRAAMVHSLLTILRAWVCAGRPTADLRPMPTYDGWGGFVRQTVVWLGSEFGAPVADPCLSMARDSARSDVTTGALARLVTALRLLLPDELARTREILSTIEEGAENREPDALDALDALEELLEAMPRRRSNRLNPRVLGKVLAIYEGRPVDLDDEGLRARIVLGKKDRKGASLWRVETLPSATVH